MNSKSTIGLIIYHVTEEKKCYMLFIVRAISSCTTGLKVLFDPS